MKKDVKPNQPILFRALACTLIYVSTPAILYYICIIFKYTLNKTTMAPVLIEVYVYLC